MLAELFKTVLCEIYTGHSSGTVNCVGSITDREAGYNMQWTQ